MRILVEHVAHIAKLAKLKFSETELQKLAGELDEILAYIEKLNELDTKNVEPLSHPIMISNVMREDIVAPSLPPEMAVKNAPESQGTFFKVPKVIK